MGMTPARKLRRPTSASHCARRASRFNATRRTKRLPRRRRPCCWLRSPRKAQQKAKKQHAQQKNILKNIFGMLAKAEGAMGSMRPTVLDAKKMHNKMKKESQAQAS